MVVAGHTPSRAIKSGFGGLTAAQRIARLPVEVTVIDRRNHHIFNRCSTRSRPLASLRAKSRRPFVGS
jgi:flavin-dependent dehydrogenase